MDHLLKIREIPAARGDRDALIDVRHHAAKAADGRRGRSSGRAQKTV
jgi:hypothetical protein